MATPAAHDGLNGAVKAYIRRMLAECGAGMKALILDATTVRDAAARSGIVAAALPALWALAGRCGQSRGQLCACFAPLVPPTRRALRRPRALRLVARWVS
jgi:hypothetical protein